MDKSKKILKRLELLHPKKIDLSLKRLTKLLRKLDNPHEKLSPIIHIAGTNGKGSVTSYLRSIFEKNNLSVHTYTSPHLIRFNERIRVNSKLINNQYLSELLEECEDKNNGESITFFEITTAAAFLAFSREKTDFTLIETGLGGKFDATNVIKKPKCCVLTPISMDHMNFLGPNITSITKEKVGIIKKNSILVLSKQKNVVRNIVRKEVKKQNAILYEEGIDWKILKKDTKKFLLKFQNNNYEFSNPNLYGDHQIENASVAIATVIATNIITDHIQMKINKGIKSVEWPGRMQRLSGGKISKKVENKFELWIDGGHNIHASEMIAAEIENWNSSKIILVLGMVSGKDPIKFVKKIAHKISLLILLPIDDHQYIQPYEIKKKLIEKLSYNIQIETCLNIQEALDFISKKITKGKILICGSLYLVGQILEEDGVKIN